MIDFINTANALYDQISALLDLIQSCDEDCIDIKSIKTAAEMSFNMLNDLNDAVNDVFDDWKSGMLSGPVEDTND